MSEHTEKIAPSLAGHQKEYAFLQKPSTLEELTSKTAELLNMLSARCIFRRQSDGNKIIICRKLPTLAQFLS